MWNGFEIVRCRSISTVTGPPGVRTTRCGTTRPSKMQRAAKVTSPTSGRSRVPSGSSTSARAAGVSGAVVSIVPVSCVTCPMTSRAIEARGAETSSTIPTAVPATRLAAIAKQPPARCVGGRFDEGLRLAPAG